MIKFVQCLRRHPDLSPADFRRLWEGYKPTWQAVAGQLGATRVSFSTTLAVEANDRLMMERGTDEAFDGLVETWVHDASDLDARRAAEPVQDLLRELSSKQHEMLDLARCSFFFCDDD